MMNLTEPVPTLQQLNEKSSSLMLLPEVTIERGISDITEASNLLRVVDLNPLSSAGLADYYMRRRAPTVTVERSSDRMGIEPDIVSTSTMFDLTQTRGTRPSANLLLITSHRRDALETAQTGIESQHPARLVPATVSQPLGPDHHPSTHATVHHSASLLSVFKRIREIAELPSNWDSDDANPTTGKAIAAACYLILAATTFQDRLGPSIVVPITSSPIPDGGLQIEWEGPRGRIDVQTNTDGSYGYMVKWGKGRHARYEETDEARLDTILALIVRVLAT